MTGQPNRAEALTRQLRGEGRAHLRGDVRDRRTIGSMMIDAADAIEALRRATPEAAPVQGVKVQALEWSKTKAGGDWSSEYPFGWLEIYELDRGFRLSRGGVDGGIYPTLEAAKAAAQADYEARILAALEPAEAQGWRTMDSAPKDRTSILALIRRDLAEVYPSYGLSMPEMFAGLQVVVRHPGLSPDGFDVGWGLAGPFGQGLGTDNFFEGWQPLPAPPAAPEGR